MLSSYQVPAQTEQIADRSMRTQKPLRLLRRFELPGCRTTHPSLSHPGRFMRLLRLIILVLLSGEPNRQAPRSSREGPTISNIRFVLPLSPQNRFHTTRNSRGQT